MFVALYVTLFLILTVVSARKFGKPINVVSLFAGIWCFFGALSTFGLYDMIIPNDIVHIYSIFFVSATSILLMIFLRGKCRIGISKSLINEIEKKQKTIFAIQVLMLVLSSYLFFKFLIVFIQTRNLQLIRNMFFDEADRGRYFFNLFFKQLPIGLGYSLIIIYSVRFFYLERIKYLMVALVDTLLLTIMTGGRYALVQLLYSVIILFAVVPNNKKTRGKKSSFIIAALVLVFIVAISVSITIQNRGGDFYKDLVIYFSGSFSYLSMILDNPTQYGLGEMMYGYMGFGFILEPIMLVLKFLGLSDAKVPSWHFNIYCQPFQNIATTGWIAFNNNTTLLYYYLRDFGFIGIVLATIVFSFVLSRFIKMWKDGKLIGSVFSIYLVIVLLNGVMTNQLFETISFFCCISLFIMTHVKKKKPLLINNPISIRQNSSKSINVT